MQDAGIISDVIMGYQGNMADNHATYLRLKGYIERASVRSGATFKKYFRAAIKEGFDIDYVPPRESYSPYVSEYMSLLNTSLKMQNKIIARLFLDAGADVNVMSQNGRNALIVAAYYMGYDEIIREIAEQTDNINHVDKYGRTAIGILCQNFCCTRTQAQGFLGSIKHLLALGADPDLDTCWHIDEEEPDIYAGQKALQRYLAAYNEQQEQLNGSQSSDYEYEI